MAVGKNFEAEKTTNHVSAASGMSSVCYLFYLIIFFCHKNGTNVLFKKGNFFVTVQLIFSKLT